MGMTYDEFWNGPPWLAQDYRKAQALTDRRRNEELWLQGLYVYEAIIDAAPLFAINAKPGTMPHPYPDEPYPRTKAEVRERKEREERRKYEEKKARLRDWAHRVNEKMKRKGEKADG